MTIHRFYTPSVGIQSRAGDAVDLDADESAHASRVLRLKAGDEVSVFGGGVVWRGEVVRAVRGEAVGVRLDEKLSAPKRASVAMTFVLPWLRGGRTEFLFQKLTELGAESLVVFDAERQTAKAGADKLERLGRIVLEAAKQCERADVPRLAWAESLVDGLLAAKSDLAIVLAERSDGLRLGDVLKPWHDSSLPNENRRHVAFAVGPEGGLTPKELEACAAFCKFASLGERILRADTVPIAVAAVALSVFGDM